MTPRPARSRRSPVVPWVVAAVAATIAVVSLLIPALRHDAPNGPGTPSGPAASVAPGPETSSGDGGLASLARRRWDDPMALGKRDAPVVLISYSDFQCPYCGKFVRDTEPTLVKKYVDTGVLRIEWRDFPYLGKESTLAARAARAAAAQGKFWPFHDALYAHQLPPNSGGLTRNHLNGLARRVGLDMARFRRDLDSDLTAKLVRHDFDEGLAIGVTGTPSFLVNGRPVVGALPLAEFERAIDTAARAAGSGATAPAH